MDNKSSSSSAMMRDSDMMIEEDTAMKAEVLYGAGCNLVSED
jgi:hypothetical protein